MLQLFDARLGSLIVIVVCCVALGLGTWRERIAGFIYALSYSFVIALQPKSSESIHFAFIVRDVVCLIAFVMLCWKSVNTWPVWACFCQAISVTVHIAYSNQSTSANPAASQWAYYTVMAASGYGVLLALLIGTLSAIRIKNMGERKNS